MPQFVPSWSSAGVLALALVAGAAHAGELSAQTASVPANEPAKIAGAEGRETALEFNYAGGFTADGDHWRFAAQGQLSLTPGHDTEMRRQIDDRRFPGVREEDSVPKRRVSEAAISIEATDLTVLILNDAGVSGKMLNEAISTATKIYAKADVRVNWLDCASSNKRRDPSCKKGLTPATRILRLVSGEAIKRLRPASGELGRAVLREDRSRGRIAYIFPSLAEELAAQVESGLAARLLFSRLLGHTIAHELAHLLGAGHAPSGVMSSSWGRDDLIEIQKGSLEFIWVEAARVTGALSDPDLLNGG